MAGPAIRAMSRFVAPPLRALVASAMAVVLGGALSCNDETSPGDGNPCTEIYEPAGTARCAVSRVSCASPDDCPASWGLAQAATTCGAGLNEITIGACGPKRAWKVSYGSPPLFVTCYYDAAGGALEGILRTSDANQDCDLRSSDLAYWVVPASCAADPNELSYPCR